MRLSMLTQFSAHTLKYVSSKEASALGPLLAVSNSVVPQSQESNSELPDIPLGYLMSSVTLCAHHGLHGTKNVGQRPVPC